MNYCLLKNGTIVNEGEVFTGHILFCDQYIVNVSKVVEYFPIPENTTIIDASDCLVLPGIIDIHVHFREPGLTQKADFWHESMAAIAGGVTTIVDMPNTIPQTTSIEAFENKIKLAQNKCFTNFSFYLGASENNIDQILMANAKKVPGIKIFFGASTGNMKLSNLNAIETIFEKSTLPILAHCEDSDIIEQNLQKYIQIYGDSIPARCHTEIRNHAACIQSTKYALSLAKKYNHPLHILHISTKEELKLKPEAAKNVTFETCPQYLVFDQEDFDRLGHLIKCNPSIKTKTDQQELIRGIINDTIDTIGSDHAPHEQELKIHNYQQAPSGMPGIQFMLQNLLMLGEKHNIPVTQIVDKMCHKPAQILQIDKRGYIRKGYFADLILIKKTDYQVNRNEIYSICGWSPFEGATFPHTIYKVFINGKMAFNQNEFSSEPNGKPLEFNRD